MIYSHDSKTTKSLAASTKALASVKENLIAVKQVTDYTKEVSHGTGNSNTSSATTCVTAWKTKPQYPPYKTWAFGDDVFKKIPRTKSACKFSNDATNAMWKVYFSGSLEYRY
jgi:hypothetical protein